jgi:septum formation protein
MMILASNSPRRRELLHQIGLDDFQVIPATGEESAPAGLTPAELVEHLARQKGEEVQKKAAAEDIVIAADTVVAIDGTVMGKPGSPEEAKEMLRTLSGRQHQVYTGVAVLRGEQKLIEHECTQVFFREMTRSEIDWYVSDGEPMDKAGAYGIQGKGARFVRRIEGDYSNVVGLPVCRLVTMLGELD